MPWERSDLRIFLWVGAVGRRASSQHDKIGGHALCDRFRRFRQADRSLSRQPCLIVKRSLQWKPSCVMPASPTSCVISAPRPGRPHAPDKLRPILSIARQYAYALYHDIEVSTGKTPVSPEVEQRSGVPDDPEYFDSNDQEFMHTLNPVGTPYDQT